MRVFNYMSRSSFNQHQQFRLSRVRAVTSYTGKIELGIASFNAGRGLLIEYKKQKGSEMLSDAFEKDHLFSPVKKLNNQFVGHFDKLYIKDPNDELSLHQIRMEYSGNLSAGFKIMSLEADKTIEYHYRR